MYRARNLRLNDLTASYLNPVAFAAARSHDKVPFHTNVMPWLPNSSRQQSHDKRDEKKCAGCKTDMNSDHFSRRQWKKIGGRCDSCVDRPTKSK
jgi:hypothetical protein